MSVRVSCHEPEGSGRYHTGMFRVTACTARASPGRHPEALTVGPSCPLGHRPLPVAVRRGIGRTRPRGGAGTGHASVRPQGTNPLRLDRNVPGTVAPAPVPLSIGGPEGPFTSPARPRPTATPRGDGAPRPFPTVTTPTRRSMWHRAEVRLPGPDPEIRPAVRSAGLASCAVGPGIRGSCLSERDSEGTRAAGGRAYRFTPTPRADGFTDSGGAGTAVSSVRTTWGRSFWPSRPRTLARGPSVETPPVSTPQGRDHRRTAGVSVAVLPRPCGLGSPGSGARP